MGLKRTQWDLIFVEKNLKNGNFEEFNNLKKFKFCSISHSKF